MGVRVDIARRQLPRLSIDATRVTYEPDYYGSPLSSTVSSARASIATSFDSAPSSAGPTFHVICLYDFSAGDEDQLSFRKNEILDIVKQEDSVRLVCWCSVCPYVLIVSSIISDYRSSPGLVGCAPRKRSYCRLDSKRLCGAHFRVHCRTLATSSRGQAECAGPGDSRESIYYQCSR